MRIATTIDIDAPTRRVWALLEDERNLRLWMPDVLETTYPGGKPEGDPGGARFLQKIREGGRVSTYEGEVTACEPPRLLGVRLGDGRHFETDVVYRLSERGAATRLDYDCEVRLKSWLGRLMIVVGGPMARRIVKRHMANLKRVAEER
jgi:uncharacterized protein YndB with AHSA1/START domain